jgi:hypothetical protein
VPKPSTGETTTASEEKPSDMPRFRIPFGGGKRSVASETDSKEETVDLGLGDDATTSSAVTYETPPVPTPAATRLTSSLSRMAQVRIPFGGGKRVESDSTEEAIDFDLGDEASVSATVTDNANQSVAENPSPEPASARLTSSFSRIAQAANSSLKETLNTQPAHGAPPKANRFAGLGASINKRVEQVNITLAKVNAGVDNATVSTPKLPEVLKKNPFARFNNTGGGSSGDAPKPAAAKPNRFSGLNVNMTQLRSSAMERVNSMRAHDEGRPKATPFDEEVSFADDEGATNDEYTMSSALDLTEEETIQEKIQPRAEIARL